MLLKIAKHIILLICLITAFSCKFLDSETFPLTENCKSYYQVLQDSIQVDGKKIYMYRIDSSECELFVRYDQKKTKLAELKRFLTRNQYLPLDSTLIDSISVDTLIAVPVEEVEEPVEVTPPPAPEPEPVQEPAVDSLSSEKQAKDSLSLDSSKKKKKEKDGFLGIF